jgi:hypothetical protein
VNRSGIFAAAFALLVLCAASLAPGAQAAESTIFETGTPRTAPERLASESLLRLSDMPAGFVVGDGAWCGEARHPSEDEGIYEREQGVPLTAEETFVKKTGTRFCFATYDRLYRAPGTGATPLRLVTFAFATPGAAAAEEGLRLGPELVEETLSTSGFSKGTAPSVGEGASQFDTVGARVVRRKGLPGVLLLWRQGAEIGGVFAVATNLSVSAAAAATYAEHQQTYLVAPRPYLAAESEDVPTFLENPEVTVPVYWLGPTFQGKGKATSYFMGAYPDRRFAAPRPGRELLVQYTNGPTLGIWTPGGWAKLMATTVGRQEWTWHCTRSRTMKLPHGHAVLYAAYAEETKTCPEGPPQHFSAHVFLPGVVIGIGESLNSGSWGYGDGAYESWGGLEAAVRALRLYRG